MKRFGKLLGWFGWARFAGLSSLIVLVMLRIADPSLVEIIRNQSFDTFQRLEPRVIGAQPVAIIDIDERSIQAIGQWPWPRTTMARMVQNTAASGAVSMGFDMVFAEADRLSPDQIVHDNPNLPPIVSDTLTNLPKNDTVFADMMARFRVIVGQTAVRSIQDNRADKHAVADVQVGFRGQDPTPHLLKFPDIVQNRPEFEKSASGRGVFTIRQDVDGVIRRVPLVMMVQEKIRLALSTEVLRVATGGSAFAITTDDAGIRDIRLAGKAIRTDNNGHVWPHYSAPSQTRYVSAVDVINATEPLAQLQGKLVLVGTSAIGLEDFRPTPLGVSMPGVEIHAQVLENILSDELLFRPHYAIAVELLVTAALGLLIVLLLPAMDALLSVLGTTAILVGYVWFSWFAFSEHRLLIDPAIPALSCFAIFLLMATSNYLREERRRQEVQTAMGQYVSPALVDQMAKNPDLLTLGGETRDLSILFSDVRGFTSVSEAYKSDPQGLTTLMNTFLTEMSDAILEHDGTIDKFMGDAVMAFWNAPLDKANHAEASCRAALRMVRRVDRLNAMRQQEDAPPLNIGIGINTGACVVGNMGSRNRFDYTALGDAVNLASRLEGQSKPYGVKVVLGSATAEKVHDTMALLELDRLRVKGKREAERIYGLFGDERVANNSDFQAIRGMNAAMLNAYRDQQWGTAFEALELLRDLEARLDLDLGDYLFVYETRIAEFRANPPGKNWDGVYEATTK